MIRLVIRRLLLGIPLVLIVATVAFFLVQLTPGSPAAAVLGTQATPEAVEIVHRFRIGDLSGEGRPIRKPREMPADTASLMRLGEQR